MAQQTRCSGYNWSFDPYLKVLSRALLATGDTFSTPELANCSISSTSNPGLAGQQGRSTRSRTGNCCLPRKSTEQSTSETEEKVQSHSAKVVREAMLSVAHFKKQQTRKKVEPLLIAAGRNNHFC